MGNIQHCWLNLGCLPSSAWKCTGLNAYRRLLAIVDSYNPISQCMQYREMTGFQTSSLPSQIVFNSTETSYIRRRRAEFAKAPNTGLKCESTDPQTALPEAIPNPRVLFLDAVQFRSAISAQKSFRGDNNASNIETSCPGHLSSHINIVLNRESPILAPHLYDQVRVIDVK